MQVDYGYSLDTFPTILPSNMSARPPSLHSSLERVLSPFHPLFGNGRERTERGRVSSLRPKQSRPPLLDRSFARFSFPRPTDEPSSPLPHPIPK